MWSGCSRRFAFLAARVHLKLDDEFPEITEALLSVVYPQLVRPIPSMSVVEFQLDPEKGKLTSGLRDRAQFAALFETHQRRALHLPHLLRHHAVAGDGGRRGAAARPAG